jgi:hypothetical protein
MNSNTRLFTRLKTKLYLVWYYSGLAYIAAKATSSENKEHYPTLPIWLLGMYLGLFGFASQHYENRLNRFENKLNTFVAQLGTHARNHTFVALALHQRYRLPLEPDFRYPWRTLKVLIYRAQPINEETIHAEKVVRIADIIVRFKDVLGCPRDISQEVDAVVSKCWRTNLDTAILEKAHLDSANLHMVDLAAAKLNKADLSLADLHKADLRSADLSRANLSGADLSNANLRGVNFQGTDLTLADLNQTNLQQVKHLTCEQLTSAKNWQLSLRDKTLACGATQEQLPRKVD